MASDQTKAPSAPKTVVIAGGTGFLGLNLAAYLQEIGYRVVLISRTASQGQIPGQHVVWDGHSLGPWTASLEGTSVLVNLAGRTVDCIKTPDHQDEILRSRVESTRVLGEALRTLKQPPPVWVQMSTAHIYGDPPERVCQEDAAFGYGLAPFVGKAWEAAFAEAILPDMRGVVLRTSFVLGRTGGALPQLARLTRWGLGGKVGHGRQGMSWIHETDMNRLFQWAIESETVQGAYLATAPQPVSNRDFMRAMRKALRRPIGLPTPAWIASLGAKLIFRTDPELALYGRYCVSKRLPEAGFEFQFPTLNKALEDLYSPNT